MLDYLRMYLSVNKSINYGVGKYVHVKHSFTMWIKFFLEIVAELFAVVLY